MFSDGEPREWYWEPEAGEVSQAFSTEEEALDAWRNWKLDIRRL